jgi:hypothetical protein
MGRVVRKLRVVTSPRGRGAGEQFVRVQYAKELAYFRERRHRVGQLLIVMIDGDDRGVAGRVVQVEDAAVEGGQDRRGPDERVVIFVPTRSIETWFAYLDGQTVDEQESYPRLQRQRDCKPHVDRLFEMCQQNDLRAPAPPSLEAACNEYHTRVRNQ